MAKKRRNRTSEASAGREMPFEAGLHFSFRYYDLSCSDYCISRWNERQIRRTLEILKDVSSRTYEDLWRDRRVYHFAEVIWQRTTKPLGYEELGIENLPAFHLGLLGVNGQKARLYGAYSTGVFYAIWFDLNHEIWPSPLRS